MLDDQYKILDISPTISKNLGVFPGDQPFNRVDTLSFESGHNIYLSKIETTLHIGAHADSSSHYHPQGQGIDQRPLEHYIGSCQVIDVTAAKEQRILPIHIDKTAILTKRILVKTSSFPDPNQWNEDFKALSPELIHYLRSFGVITVGIDTPSVDLQNSKDLPSHQALYQCNMAVLEGLVLDNIGEGQYFLIAPPIKIKNADAAPVRAVLLQNQKTV